jgi:hypothetical protein
MQLPRPEFMDSPYFVRELGNWHLKPGAPEKVKVEFNEFMKVLKWQEVQINGEKAST